MGLTAIPMEADTGPIGGDKSHELLFLRILVNLKFIVIKSG